MAHKASSHQSTLRQALHFHLRSQREVIREIYKPIQHPVQRVKDLVVGFPAEAIRRGDGAAEESRGGETVVCEGGGGGFDGGVGVGWVFERGF